MHPCPSLLELPLTTSVGSTLSKPIPRALNLPSRPDPAKDRHLSRKVLRPRIRLQRPQSHATRKPTLLVGLSFTHTACCDCVRMEPWRLHAYVNRTMRSVSHIQVIECCGREKLPPYKFRPNCGSPVCRHSHPRHTIYLLYPHSSTEYLTTSSRLAKISGKL